MKNKEWLDRSSFTTVELLRIYLIRILLNERKAIMDWKILIATFTSIFLAELGDKTQIAAIIMTSKTNKPLTIFIGSMIAFAVITLIGVTFGAALTKFVPIDYIKYLSAIAFIAIGILILTGKL